MNDVDERQWSDPVLLTCPCCGERSVSVRFAAEHVPAEEDGYCYVDVETEFTCDCEPSDEQYATLEEGIAAGYVTLYGEHETQG